MALIRFIANPATARESGARSISYSLMGGAPIFPSREVECRTWRDCEAAFDAYSRDAHALGLGMALSMRVASGRTPSGFRKLPWQRFVNC